jgi:formamidopyrimidine-DNA glycosylase
LPELPEVETVVRSVRPHLVGRTIEYAEVRSKRVTRRDFAATVRGLTGARIVAVRRLGKQILVELNQGLLYIHLGMTGKLLWNGVAGKYTRALLEFENGALLFDDVRQFGRFEFFPELPSGISVPGPDALDIDFATFLARLKGRRGSIKALLLNQSFIAGVGNIYADELLFAARVHPKTDLARLSAKRAAEVHRRLLETLRLAVEMRGSSISDYVDAAGARGEYQQRHQVYGRAGEPCPSCGGPIRRIVVAQRGTHYCPRCQRA